MKRLSTYRNIQHFGGTDKKKEYVAPVDNPLTYCMDDKDQYFLHGTQSILYGAFSKPCQAYMSDYCANGWDGFCEVASQNVDTSHPNQIQLDKGSDTYKGLTAGEILIKNTAVKKYLVNMDYCVLKSEAFDPLVASSPMVSYWVGDNTTYTNKCQPSYAVDPKVIDKDIVMDKILSKPSIALDLLANIYLTMTNQGTIKNLKGTKIGKYFEDNFGPL